MKKVIIIIAFLIILCQFTVGVEGPNTEVEIGIRTDGDMDSTIIEVADGDIDNEIYCQAGGDCNYNLYNGQINIPEGDEGLYDITSYRYTSYTSTGNGGLSLGELNSQLYHVKDDFLEGVKKALGRYDIWDFLSLMSQVFVTRTEYNALSNNVNYLANELDEVKAENKVLRAQLNIMELDKKNLECQMALQKAYRYGTEIRTPSGMIANPQRYGDICIQVN